MRSACSILSCLVLLSFRAHADSAQVSDDGTWQCVSPDGKLFAALAVEQDETRIWRQGLGRGLLEVVHGGKSARWYGPFMCFSIGDRMGVRAEWSPDSHYLVVTTANLGGHSPWHSNAFVYDASSDTLREMDDTVGLVVSPKFTFSGPHSVKMKIGTTGSDGSFDFEHPKEVVIDLDQQVAAMRKVPPFKAGDLNHD